MVDYLKESKLTSIGLTLNFDNKEWDFKLELVKDRFSEDHPYCKRECDACRYGTHSQCDTPEECHDTDEERYWIELD